jgi:hypothetical protein
MLPEVDNTGFEVTLQRHATMAANFGAYNMLLRNPGGTDDKSMQFEQWLLRHPEVSNRVDNTSKFRRGVQHCLKSLGRLPAVYLGCVKEDGMWAWYDNEELIELVRECVRFIPRGCRIFIDGAGSDTGAGAISPKVIAILKGMGYPGGVEPWISIHSSLATDREVMGVTASGYYRALMATPHSGYAPEMLPINISASRQLLMVEEAAEPPIQEIVGWLAQGLDVAVKPDEACLYQGYTAYDIERAAQK